MGGCCHVACRSLSDCQPETLEAEAIPRVMQTDVGKGSWLT
jgi:hypothetical protein